MEELPIQIQKRIIGGEVRIDLRSELLILGVEQI